MDSVLYILLLYIGSIPPTVDPIRLVLMVMFYDIRVL